MPSGYTKSDFLDLIDRAGDDMSTFYQQDFVNYRGKTADTGELYTEVVAMWCADNLSYFERIPVISRKSSYKTPTHDGVPDNESSNRDEERIAMAMFRQGMLPRVGRVIDYQTPLKNRRSDPAGKIDLLAYDGNTLRILELKKPDSTETMLRCVLEGETYLRTVDRVKLLNDFNLPAGTPVTAAPFVFYNGEQRREMAEQRPQLKRLMSRLKCQPIYIIQTGKETYDVTED